MIINNAGSRCDADFCTKHLQNTEENERAELNQIRGLKADNLQDALLEIQREAADHPRLKNFMYHADFNPRGHERFTEEQWERSFEIFEKERGIPAGQPRIVYEHEKEGRIHRHVIWARLNPETMRAFSDGLDARIAHAAAAKIALEFGLEKIISPFDREPGTPRPPRAPKPWEMYRAMQTGIDPRDIQAKVTELRQQSENGKAFQAALEFHGYELVTGRRGLLILDSAGKEHSLAKRAGMTMAELNAFMRDVDRAALPTVEQAKEQYRERKIGGLEADRATVHAEIQWHEALEKAAIAKEKIERQFVEPQERAKEETRAGREQAAPTRREERHWPVNPPQHQAWPGFEKAATEATRDERTQDLRGPAAQVWAAWCQSDDDKVIAAALDGKAVSFAVPTKEAFAVSLDGRGISFAAATKEEAERSHREAEFAKAVGNYAPRFKQGEIVIITEQRPEYRRDDQAITPPRVHKLDQSLAQKFTKHLGIRSQLHGIEATLKASDERAQRRAADWEAIRDVYAETRLHRNRTNAVEKGIRDGAATTRDAIHKSAAAIQKTVSIAASFGKVFDVVGSLVEAFAAPKLTPQQILDGEKAKDRREAEADNTIDFSRVTAEQAQQRQQQDNEQEAARQRQRDDGGGRER